MEKIKINCAPNCRYAPKKEFLRAFNVAFAEGNVDYLVEHVTDDIRWNIVGDQVVTGKSAFRTFVDAMKESTITELLIENILTHGREGAVAGAMKMTDGQTYSFADIYTFSGAKGEKIKAFTSYVVESYSEGDA